VYIYIYICIHGIHREEEEEEEEDRIAKSLRSGATGGGIGFSPRAPVVAPNSALQRYII